MSQQAVNPPPPNRHSQPFPLHRPSFPGQYIVVPPPHMYPQIFPTRPMFVSQIPFVPNPGMVSEMPPISVNRPVLQTSAEASHAPLPTHMLPSNDFSIGDNVQSDKINEDFFQFIVNAADKPDDPELHDSKTRSKSDTTSHNDVHVTLKDNHGTQLPSEQRSKVFKMDVRTMANCKSESAPIQEKSHTKNSCVERETKTCVVTNDKVSTNRFDHSVDVETKISIEVAKKHKKGKDHGVKHSQQKNHKSSLQVSVTTHSDTEKSTVHDLPVTQNDEEWVEVESKKKRKPKAEESRSTSKSSNSANILDESNKFVNYGKKRGIIPKEAISQRENSFSNRKKGIITSSRSSYFSESITADESHDMTSHSENYEKRRNSNIKSSNEKLPFVMNKTESSDSSQKKKIIIAETSIASSVSKVLESTKQPTMMVHVNPVKKPEKPSSPYDDLQNIKKSTPEPSSKFPPSISLMESENEFSNIGAINCGRITYSRAELIQLKDLEISKVVPKLCQQIHPKLLKINQSQYPAGSHGRRHGRSHGVVVRTHCPWMAKKEALKNMPEDEANEERLLMFIRSSLNKLSETTFKAVSTEIATGPIKSKKNIHLFVDKLYEKAIQDLKFIPLYSMLCKSFMTDRPNDKSLFQDILLKKLKNKKRIPELEKEFDQSILESNRDNPCIDTLISLLYEKELTYKIPYRGNAEFFARLYCERVMSIEMLSSFIEQYLLDNDDFSIDILLRVLTTCGKILEKECPSVIEKCMKYFDKLKNKMPPKINYRVSDLRDLRTNKWETEKEGISVSTKQTISFKNQENVQTKPDWSSGSSGGRNLSSSMTSTSYSNRHQDRSGGTTHHDNNKYRGNNSYSNERSGSYSRNETNSYKSHSGNVPSSAPASNRAPRFKKCSSSSVSNVPEPISLPSPASLLSLETLERMREIANTQVTEFGSHHDVEIADASLMSSDIQLHMQVYVQTAIEVYLEMNFGHLYLGNYLLHLLDESLLKTSDLFSGLQKCMQMMEDLSIDVPNAFDRLILILLPLVCQKKLSLSKFQQFMIDGAVSDPSAHIIKLMKYVNEKLSLVDVICIWQESGLKIEKLTPPINQLTVKEYGLDFLISPNDTNFYQLQKQTSVHRLLTDEKISPSHVLTQFQKDSFYAHMHPSSHVLRSMIFSCPIGPGKLVSSYLKRTIKNNLHLFEWMCTNDQSAVISMINDAHDYCHDHQHIPYRFCSALTENLLIHLPSFIKSDEIRNACSHSTQICKFFQTEINSGINSFESTSLSSSCQSGDSNIVL